MSRKIARKGQVHLEFVTAFAVLIIFLFAATKIFVWMSNNYIERHKAYEKTRKAQWEWFTMPGESVSPVVVNFYDQSARPLRIFSE